ncbi:MAG: hypothetical protein LBU92_04310 [Prevotellaceae bacterium]|jgi:hypothetical protein|nr:hypothetical protein [Prevotellaceae bacterium]
MENRGGFSVKRKTLFFMVFFCLSFTVAAQPEHHLGLIGGKVMGASYTLQYKRWSADANAGWLTGLRGGYGSVNGLYRLFVMEKNVGSAWQDGATWFNIGLGVFAQGYTEATQHQQELAKKLQYNTPVGVQAVVQARGTLKVFPRWSFGFNGTIPFTLNEEFGAEKLSFGEVCLGYLSLSVQYKIR